MMSNTSQHVGEVDQIGLYGNLIVSVAVCSGILYQANRLVGIDWQSICWSIGLTGLLLALAVLRYRMDPPTRQAPPAGVATLRGLVVGYVVCFILLLPESADLAETIFERFWPLFLGWAITWFVKSIYYLLPQKKELALTVACNAVL